MASNRLIGLVGVLCLVPALSWSDYVEVRKSANIYSQPSSKSTKLGRGKAGDTFPLLSDKQTKGYYLIDFNGINAWVYRTRVRLRSGEIEPLPDEIAPPANELTIKRVSSVNDLSSEPPAKGTYRIHLIDLGTGLSILVQGNDFNMLFDGGSADDYRSMSRSRLVAYLYAALGPSGPSGCKPEGDSWPTRTSTNQVTIDHVVLSHPHFDHGNLLDDVLRCYDVDHVWDVGVVNDTVFYRAFLEYLVDEAGVSYHTAIDIPADRTITVRDTPIKFPETIVWSRFTNQTSQTLGEGASFRILHADGAKHSDPNENSIVLRLNLGGISVLLTGDAESGPRLLPEAELGDIEAELLQLFPNLIDVDILQVGHHGSLTSSRLAFLQAVSPRWALIGCGPKSYSGHVLPDHQVIEALNSLGVAILRTDVHDGIGCDVPDRIGTDEGRPGGCDSYVLEIGL